MHIYMIRTQTHTHTQSHSHKHITSFTINLLKRLKAIF